MKTLRYVLVPLYILLFVCPPVHAWNAVGHSLVAKIAYARLKPDERQKVVDILKQHPHYRRIPVVMLTSSRESRDLQTTYDLGANSYIEKPVSFSRFLDIAAQIESYWCSANERAY